MLNPFQCQIGKYFLLVCSVRLLLSVGAALGDPQVSLQVGLCGMLQEKGSGWSSNHIHPFLAPSLIHIF